jgi:phage recombination protein Bet
VTAPDGGAEYRAEAGVYCLDCGAIEDEPEFREMEEAEFMTQTVTIRDAGGTMAAPQPGLSREQVQLLKDTICKGATDEELRLFVEVCKRKNLDPFSKQIHPVRRWDSTLRREVMTFQTGIDGLRLAAQRSGEYAGQTAPRWCGPDGKWREVWLDKTPPAGAMVGVHRTGFKEPMFAIALYSEYAQITKEGGPNSMWKKMPSNQLAKCAEALALRRAFPEELSGLYAPEEMGQADRDPDPPRAASPPRPAAAKTPAEQEGPDRPWKTYKGMVAEFGDLKARLEPNAGVYYEVLSEFGVRHCNEFKNLPNATANATAAYFKLLDRVRQYEADRQAADEAEIIDAAIEEVMPPEEGATA